MDSNPGIFFKLNGKILRCTQIYMDKRLEKFNITIGIYPYLLVLSRMSGINQSEISREINVDKSMSARAIKKLISLGYIKKIEDIKDTRAYKLYLTEKGTDVVPYIVEALRDWFEILLGNAKDEEVEITHKILNEALENGEKWRKNFCKGVCENGKYK
ncbi:MAG: MarR family winged helix-turn-helix transcriptional regulator [Clostridium sp.]|nr:MarR family winged helix-turn-helix transcriptional regulator [Clostridium sp.]